LGINLALQSLVLIFISLKINNKGYARKKELIVELFSGYANGIITDEECCDMIDCQLRIKIKVMNQEKQYIKEMLQYADELGMGIEVRDDAKQFMNEFIRNGR
jgi:hypothetical protein